MLWYALFQFKITLINISAVCLSIEKMDMQVLAKFMDLWRWYLTKFTLASFVFASIDTRIVVDKVWRTLVRSQHQKAESIEDPFLEVWEFASRWSVRIKPVFV